MRPQGARPAPPSHSPVNVAIRKLTISKIPVKLTSDRDKVANEVLTSEQTYFQSLLILGSFYIGPILHTALATGNTLVYDTFQAIGFAADALVPYNQALLTELEKKMRSWSNDECLGDVFQMVSRMQGVYLKYIQAYSEMIARVSICEKNAAFAAQMKELKKDGMVNQLDLRSYLIMPVRRSMICLCCFNHNVVAGSEVSALRAFASRLAEINVSNAQGLWIVERGFV